jgi:hypothetical protein
MTNEQKIEIINTLLEDGCEAITTEKLETYLAVAADEILSWMYHLVGGVPDDVTEVPEKYNTTQIYAVVAGYTHAGAEGESRHNENGIDRTFMYSDMLDYIHNHVLPIVRVGAVR